jgi:hypothetical protein
MKAGRLERKVRVTYINGIRTGEAECRAHAELIADLFAAPCYALHNKTAGAWADLSQVGIARVAAYDGRVLLMAVSFGMRCRKHMCALVSASSSTPACGKFASPRFSPSLIRLPGKKSLLSIPRKCWSSRVTCRTTWMLWTATVCWCILHTARSVTYQKRHADYVKQSH